MEVGIIIAFGSWGYHLAPGHPAGMELMLIAPLVYATGGTLLKSPAVDTRQEA